MKNIIPSIFILALVTAFTIRANSQVPQVWDSLGSGLNSQGYSFCIYNNELYVGGDFTQAGGVNANGIARWNGSTWDSVGSGVAFTALGQGVYTMAVYDGELYVAGVFDSAGGVPVNNVARWNGVAWDSIGSGLTVGGASCACKLLVFNNSLYVTGNFTVANAPRQSIARWTGTSWTFPGIVPPYDILGTTGANYAGLCVYNNYLYSPSENPFVGDGVAYTDGSVWDTVPPAWGLMAR